MTPTSRTLEPPEITDICQALRAKANTHAVHEQNFLVLAESGGSGLITVQGALEMSKIHAQTASELRALADEIDESIVHLTKE